MNEVADLRHISTFGEARSEKETTRPSRAVHDSRGVEAGALEEEIAAIVYQIFLKEREEPLNTVVFSAVEQGNGCSLLARETASMLARHAGSVCLLEANFRSPSLAKSFGLIGHIGLADILNTEEPIFPISVPVDGFPEDRFRVIPSGSVRPGASVLLTSLHLKARLRELESRFRYVIVDAPPLSCPETLPLAKLASGLIMVLEAGRTRRDAAVAAAAKVKAADVELLGAVLNKRTFAIPAGVYNRL